MGGNGEQQKKYPKGKHPNTLANLKPFKPGAEWTGNAEGARAHKPKHRDPMTVLLDTLAESRTVTLDDGTTIQLDRLQQAMLLMVNKWSRGPTHPTNDPNWRWAGDIIMSRICPIPKTPMMGGDVDRAIIAEISHEKVTLAFVERVREFAGRNDPRPDDVLRFLDESMDNAE